VNVIQRMFRSSIGISSRSSKKLLVEREQVESGVEDACREGLELLDQRLHGRAELRALVGDCGRRHAGEREQV
jgi:hypothetical protein